MWVRDHPTVAGTFGLIIGWASVEGPNSTSRALFREALRTAAAVALVGVVTVAFYGELRQPGYSVQQAGAAVAAVAGYLQSHVQEAGLAAVFLAAFLFVPNSLLALGGLATLAGLSLLQGQGP